MRVMRIGLGAAGEGSRPRPGAHVMRTGTGTCPPGANRRAQDALGGGSPPQVVRQLVLKSLELLAEADQHWSRTAQRSRCWR